MEVHVDRFESELLGDQCLVPAQRLADHTVAREAAKLGRALQSSRVTKLRATITTSGRSLFLRLE